MRARVPTHVLQSVVQLVMYTYQHHYHARLAPLDATHVLPLILAIQRDVQSPTITFHPHHHVLHAQLIATPARLPDSLSHAKMATTNHQPLFVLFAPLAVARAVLQRRALAAHLDINKLDQRVLFAQHSALLALQQMSARCVQLVIISAEATV